MSTRRTFIKQSSLLSAAFLVNPDSLLFKQTPIGLQIYTLRDQMFKDSKGTLKQVADLGFNTIETFAYMNGKWFGMTAKELSAYLKSIGLSSPSGHTFLASIFLKEGWEDSWKQAVADAKELGQEYIVIPWLEEAHRGSVEKYKKIAEGLNKAAVVAQSGGLQLAYHNHDFEFDKIGGGVTGFDILSKETDPALVKFELDLYWTVRAGHNPIELFNQHPGRISMWHVKDMDKTEKKFFTEVGNGTIDFKGIFEHAKHSGMKYFFVEQDVCPGNPLDSIKQSIGYLRKNLVK